MSVSTNALATFCGQDESERRFTPELSSIMEATAKTGNYWHDWSQLKVLLSFRLKQVLKELQESHPDMTENGFYELLKRMDELLGSFVDGAPFTIQRICELLVYPPNSYFNIDKFTLAFEKLLLVTSTVPPSTDAYPLVHPDSHEKNLGDVDMLSAKPVSEADLSPNHETAMVIDSINPVNADGI